MGSPPAGASHPGSQSESQLRAAPVNAGQPTEPSQPSQPELYPAGGLTFSTLGNAVRCAFAVALGRETVRFAFGLPGTRVLVAAMQRILASNSQKSVAESCF